MQCIYLSIILLKRWKSKGSDVTIEKKLKRTGVICKKEVHKPFSFPKKVFSQIKKTTYSQGNGITISRTSKTYSEKKKGSRQIENYVEPG